MFAGDTQVLDYFGFTCSVRDEGFPVGDGLILDDQVVATHIFFGIFISNFREDEPILAHIFQRG